MLRLRHPLLTLLFAPLLAWGTATPAPAAAQEAPLPDAAELIDRHVEALGGRDAVLTPRSTRTRGILDLPGLGAEGEMEVLMTRDGATISSMTIPGMGETRTGFDGEVGWSIDGMSGPRVLEGAELDGVRDGSQPLAVVRDASLFAARETMERTEMGGEPCYLVRLEWLSGRETLECYHVETGLAVATAETAESPMGSMEVTTFFEEYEEVGGVLVPMRSTQEMMGQRFTIRVTEVTYDDVDPGELEPPSAVRALLEAGGSGR